MQIRAVECRLKITEIPVTFRQRQAGNSKISGTLLGTLAAAIGILKILTGLWWTRSRRIHRVSESAR